MFSIYCDVQVLIVINMSIKNYKGTCTTPVLCLCYHYALCILTDLGCVLRAPTLDTRDFPCQNTVLLSLYK